MKKKPASKLDEVRRRTAEAVNHGASRGIQRHRDVLLFQLAAVEEHLLELNGDVAQGKARRAELQSKIEGLNDALAVRRAGLS